jgi:hypothetical protein
MRINVLKSAFFAIFVASLSFAANASLFSYDYSYNGSGLTINQTSSGSQLAVGDTVDLKLRAVGGYWTATASQHVWPAIQMQEAADRTGDATWTFFLNGLSLNTGSYTGQDSAAGHIINFTSPSVDVSFDELDISFLLTNYSPWNLATTTDTLGDLYVFGDGSSAQGPFLREHVNFVQGSTDPTTIPEPATMALLGLGLAGIAGSRRRKIQ